MAGWPWPLDGVQAWFEDLWGWISEAARSAVSIVFSWVNDASRWLYNQLTAVGGWLWERFQEVGEGLSKLLTEEGAAILKSLIDAVSSIGQGVSGGFAWVWDQFTRIGSWITGIIWGWIDGALRWATDCFRWLQTVINESAQWIVDELSGFLADVPDMLGNIGDFIQGAVMDAGDWIVDQVGVAFDGASIAIGETIKSVFAPIIEPFSAFLTTFTDILKMPGPETVKGFLTAYGVGSPSPGTPMFKLSSPLTPEEGFKQAWEIVAAAESRINTGLGQSILIEAATLGQVDITVAALLAHPTVRADSRIAEATRTTEFETAIVPLIQQYWLKKYTPYVPPIDDLIRFVVREVILPEKFYEYMPLRGFSDEIAKWYWEAHWVLPPITLLYDAYHRGVITRDELDKYIVLHDYKPEPRPGIAKSDQEIIRSVIKTLIPRVDLRYGWELGMLSDEDLVKRYEHLGYEEDSEMMAKIQMARAMSEEISGVKSEWISDYVDGLRDEATLRANLDAVGIVGIRQDYYVAKASLARDRKTSRKRLEIYREAFLKDLITEDELDARAREILVVPDAIDTFLDEAYIDKYKKPTPPKPEKVKVASLTYLTTAYREETITEAAFREELTRRGFDPDSIDLMVTVETMKKLEMAEKEARKLAPPPPEEVKTATLTYLATAFRLDVITEASFREELVRRKYTPESIATIIEVETLKKVKAAGE